MDYYKIGQKIRKIRKSRGLTQEELAERVGISVTHMSHIETGNTKLGLPVLVNLALSLEARTDEILFDTPPADRNATINAIVRLLNACTEEQLPVIEDIVKATKASLDRHR